MRHGKRRILAAFYALQGGGVILWWAILHALPATRGWFFRSGEIDAVLGAFMLPDLVVLGIGSLLTAFALRRQTGAARPLAWLVAGAAIYAMAAELHAGMDALRFTARVQLGLVLFLLFSAGGLWSGYVIATRGRGTPLPLDAPRAFVVAGPYRYIRNPMAVTGLGQGTSVSLAMGSYGVLLYVFAGGLLWNFVFRPLEEADLEARFGEAYRAYRRHVPCWCPRLRAYSGEWAQ